MILTDTNIISEMMKPIPNTNVRRWIDSQEIMQLYISTVTIAEISYGLNALPDGHRRLGLEQAFNKVILGAFSDRILTFDESAAYQYGKIMGYRKILGQPMGVPDGQIAAIASVHNAAIATRNINDFTNCGLVLINPFESRPLA